MADDYLPAEKRIHYSNNAGSSHSGNPYLPTDTQPPELAQEQRAPSGHVAAGKTLADFLTDVKAITPVIPDSVAQYYMKKNGLNNEDPRIIRLISIATQKFISDIALDTMQSARMQGLGQLKKGNRDARFVINTELLEPVLEEYGIPFDRPNFYH
uniref:Transcription initiation factor TFIID subunit 10 n=1 Tax=Bursaphelenchus xylophilus TaxID=6326 RepID=A0A1I7SDN9_BURXY